MILFTNHAATGPLGMTRTRLTQQLLLLDGEAAWVEVPLGSGVPAQVPTPNAKARWLLLQDESEVQPDSLGVSLAMLTHSAKVELFELDCTIVGGDVLRFHAGVNEHHEPVVWQGQAYMHYPIEMSGFDKTTDGPLPQPVLRASNIEGTLAALLREFRGLKGSKITRKRTLARYLDAANFVDGNAHADPLSHYPDDVYYLDRITNRNRHVVEYRCASPMDVQGVFLPRRVVLHNICMWTYRGADCGYFGPAVADANDVPTAVLANDACGHRLASCRLRQWHSNDLPFGGFPGAGVLRNA